MLLSFAFAELVVIVAAVVRADTTPAAKGPTGAVLITEAVPAVKCQFPFKFNNALYYGCTTAGDSRAWCVLQNTPERGAQDWRYCDPATIASAVASIVPDPRCADPGWPSGNQTVYGCMQGAGEAGFGCKPINSSNVLPCKLPDVAKSAALSMTAAAASSSSSAPLKLGPNVPIGAIAGSVAGVVAVALIVGIILYRRRTAARKKSPWTSSNGNDKGFGDGLDIAGPHASPADFRFADLSGGAGGGPQQPPPPVPAERCYPVISTYTPTLGDELEIQPGDKVQLVIEYDDGWCQGINLSRGGAKGVFPKHCIDMTSPI